MLGCVCGQTHRNLCISDIKKKLFKCKRNTLATATAAADKENRKNQVKVFSAESITDKKRAGRNIWQEERTRKNEKKRTNPAGMQQRAAGK